MLALDTPPAVLQEETAKLLGSLLLFTQVFFKLRTGREFALSQPNGRESHFISISRALTSTFRHDFSRLIINVPPRYGKTELLIHFVAWCMAHYPDSNFLYISYSHSLAAKQTQIIRQIIGSSTYRRLFGIELASDSSAKDNFETTAGGSVYAAGSGGSITGRGAGVRGQNRFGGCIVIDDIIKPSEASSDTIREAANDWYYNTLQSRLNTPETPIINCGQRTNEADMAGQQLTQGGWDSVILPAEDKGFALYPELHPITVLRRMEKEEPYTYAAQYQQNPQPAGGGLFKPEWFVLLDHEPTILSTFITADTAETSKNYNDATVFSFWGLYKIEDMGIETDVYALHWLDCMELRVEPKDLQNEFTSFYAECMQHPVKPQLVAIEKKSTGVTLASVLGEMRGLRVMGIERNSASGSKIDRFIEAQQYVASKRISFTYGAKHHYPCVDHCRKITANNSHRHDDIADTLYDAIKIAFIDKTILNLVTTKAVIKTIPFAQQLRDINQARQAFYVNRF